jgi:flagellar basal body-associated protein FliL
VQRIPPIGGPGAASYKVKGDSSEKTVYILIGAIVLVLLVVGVLYFTVMRKSKPPGPGPEATAQKYFAEMSNGNVAGVQALFTPDCRPTEDQVIQEMSELITCRGSSAKIVNVKLSVSNKTATSATVTVKDITISASGRTASLSDMGPVPKIDQKVVLINGQWMLSE